MRADEARAAGDQKVHGQTLAITGQGVECAGKAKASPEPKPESSKMDSAIAKMKIAFAELISAIPKMGKAIPETVLGTPKMISGDGFWAKNVKNRVF